MNRSAGRRQAADGLNAQQRMDGQRGAPVGDTGGRVTRTNAPAPRADRPGLQQRRLFAGPGAPFGQSR